MKQGAKLIVSYVGYDQTTVVWNGGAIEIVMSANSNALDEVVVVGYGVQKKVNLTGAVSQVKGEDIAKRPVGDAAQMLQGVIPGLTVSNNNAGRPGGSATLQLRGQGNLSGTGTPYVLVDGIEMSLSEVNPTDIESISVLKDAGASAIYGARAAYGVILVTTKRGQEGNMRISYNGSVGWNSPTKLPDMLDGYEFAKYWNHACSNAGVTRFYSDEKLELLRQFRDNPSSVDPWQELSPNANMNPAFENSESGIGNTDYFDLHYKDWAFKQNHNVSASGGGKRAQYYVSLGYYGEDGILRYADMKYDRYNFASTISSQLTSWLRIHANAKLMHSDNRTPFGDGGLSEGFYHSLARFRPTVHYLDPNGHFTELTMIPYLQSGTKTETKLDRSNVTFGVEVEPVKNWKIFADYTYRHLQRQYSATMVAPDIYGADGETTTKGVRSELGIQRDGRYTRQEATTRYQNFNAYTNYMITLALHDNPRRRAQLCRHGRLSVGREPLLISLQLCHRPLLVDQPRPQPRFERRDSRRHPQQLEHPRLLRTYQLRLRCPLPSRSQHALRRHIALCQKQPLGLLPIGVGRLEHRTREIHGVAPTHPQPAQATSILR